MDAFLFQRLPDLAFRDVVQGMEPMDIFHVTQASYKTRCLMSRNARLPITIAVDSRFIHFVRFEFCGSRNQPIVFKVNPLFNGPHSRLYKFGKYQKDWSETSYYDNPSEGLGTHWNNKFEGYKTIINYLADIFLVKYVSLNGRDDESFNLLKHIADRKLPIQDLLWNSERSTEAVVQVVFEIATAANKFNFKDAHWITLDGLYALNNCLKVTVSWTQLTGTDLNAFLKHLIHNTGRTKEWVISSHTKFDMKTVLTGIEHDEIAKSRFEEEYTVERVDGVAMNVKYIPPPIIIGARNPQCSLIVKVLNPSA